MSDFLTEIQSDELAAKCGYEYEEVDDDDLEEDDSGDCEFFD